MRPFPPTSLSPDPTMAHRIGDVSVTVRDGAGRPVADQDVVVAQRRHAFGFGNIGFDLIPLANGETARRPEEVETFGGPSVDALSHLADLWLDLFNTATLPFYWGRFEPERGKPDTRRLLRTAEWFTERGVALKGHPLLWHTVTAPWLRDLPTREGGAGPARADPTGRRGLRRPDRHLGRDQRGRDHAGLRQGRQRDHPAVPRHRPDRDGAPGLRRGARHQPAGHPAAQRLRHVHRLRVPDRGCARGRHRDRRARPAEPHAPGLLGGGEDAGRPRAHP